MLAQTGVYQYVPLCMMMPDLVQLAKNPDVSKVNPDQSLLPSTSKFSIITISGANVIAISGIIEGTSNNAAVQLRTWILLYFEYP
jgi:hypothetical protein